jgi:hypothetical protein
LTISCTAPYSAFSAILAIGGKVDLTPIRAQLERDGIVVVPTGLSLSVTLAEGYYYIDTDPTDTRYVRIGYPGFWTITTTGQYLAALEICSQISQSMKAVKMYVQNSAVHCTVEQFVSGQDFSQDYRRYITAIQGAVRRFHELMAAHPK